VSLCPERPTKYTRNLIFGNEHFDCILMCWPAGAVSSIHDHEESSCWVVAVEGTVHEVQFGMPELGERREGRSSPVNTVVQPGVFWRLGVGVWFKRSRVRVVRATSLPTGSASVFTADRDPRTLAPACPPAPPDRHLRRADG